MKKKISHDPYRTVIQNFNRKGIHYVVVGMAGINYYAKDARSMFGTLDYDVFLEPSLENVEKAIRVLEKLEFTLSTSEGRMKKEDLRELVRNRRTFVATTPEGILVELLLEVSGFPFSELARDAATFDAGGVPIRVGSLEKLLQSKRIAGRRKDREFLRRYQSLLEES